MIALAAFTAPANALVGGPFSGNDNIVTAQATLSVPPVPISWTGSNVGATTEAGELLPCLMSNTVWFSFVAVVPGIVTIDTFGSNYDTALAAYSGAPGATSPAGLTFLTCNDDFQGLQSQISFPATTGSTYYVQAGGWFGNQGNLRVTFR
jgi:hypothetical protein